MTSRLVIAYNFPPFNDGSSVTVAKRLIERRNQVDVISKDMSDIRTKDASLWSLVEPLIRRHRMIPGKSLFTMWQSVEEFVAHGLEALAEWGNEYAEVYSRSMFIHSHFLAAVARLDGKADRWVAEFSDPLLHDAGGEYRPSGVVARSPLSQRLIRALPQWGRSFVENDGSLFALAQAASFSLADELIFTNEQQRTVMLETIPTEVRSSLLRKSTIAPHPSLPPTYYPSKQSLDPEHFRIGFFGTFYPNRGAGEFLEGWAGCEPSVRDRILLDIFTDADTKALLRAGRRLGLENQIFIRQALPLLEFIRVTARYDALLVTDVITRPFTVPSPFLPSKVSDYLPSPTPTFAITLDGSPLDELSLSIKAHLGDLASVRGALSQAVLAKLENSNRQDS